jgi:hypothetical protein
MSEFDGLHAFCCNVYGNQLLVLIGVIHTTHTPLSNAQISLSEFIPEKDLMNDEYMDVCSAHNIADND